MRGALIVLAVLGVLIAGCGNRQKDLAGTWAGEALSTRNAQSGPGADAQQATYTRATLALKADGSFTLTIAGATTDGNWELKGDDVVLTAKSAGGKTYEQVKAEAEKLPGMPMDVVERAWKPMPFRLSPDGREMIGKTTDGGVESGELKLRKQ